ncbi:HD domain-containing protein [Neolewinella persica]|uniref:HD domain-containing protein n=1 Tax=Neolewinella persica TaxID=70998 RepID=UPI0003693EE0|nr:HD domain-containing protein [Neolewinella persica]
MPNLLQKAWLLAAHHHENQRYNTPIEGLTLPYLTHIGAVLIEAQQALHHHPEFDADLLLCSAVLHDTLEDTDLTPDQVETTFGKEILTGVRALTKDENLPSKREQMEDSLQRILAAPPEIAAVKLCDRINNLSPPPHYWTPTKKAAYREEAQLILDQLGHVSTYLSQRLAGKIAAYPTS